MSNSPDDIDQEKQFSTPQCIYDKNMNLSAQATVCPDGFLWVRKATIKNNQWGEWTRIIELEKEIERLTVLNKNMHTCVAGYLKGKEWQHWQQFNEPKFILK